MEILRPPAMDMSLETCHLCRAAHSSMKRPLALFPLLVALHWFHLWWCRRAQLSVFPHRNDVIVNSSDLSVRRCTLHHKEVNASACRLDRTSYACVVNRGICNGGEKKQYDYPLLSVRIQHILILLVIHAHAFLCFVLICADTRW